MRKYDKYMSVFQQINEAPQLILIQFHAIQKGEKNMEGGNLLYKKGEKTKKTTTGIHNSGLFYLKKKSVLGGRF